LDKIDSRFLIELDESIFEIDGKTKVTNSCLNGNHAIIKDKNNYGIYLLCKRHPRFDIFLKLPCAQRKKFDEIHIFIQTKTSKTRYYESSSYIKTTCDEFTEALDCHRNKYSSLTNRRILTCMVLIDSRHVKDIEDIQTFTDQDKFPCKFITFDELKLLFPNFSHRFLARNSKDFIQNQTK